MIERFRKRVQLALAALGLRLDHGDWLVPGTLLACAYPKKDAALASLKNQGITVLVNLHERAHSPARLSQFDLSSTHIPMKDFAAPTHEQIAQGIAAIEDALSAGQRVAVHCGGGIGRTGTMLACYLVRQGATADSAIRRVRTLRPGSVETRGQVAAIHAFAARTAASADSARVRM